MSPDARMNRSGAGGKVMRGRRSGPASGNAAIHFCPCLSSADPC